MPILTGAKLYAAIAGAVAVALLFAWVMRIDHLRGQHLKERIACEQNHAQFVADVKARTDEARRLDAAHKATVEAQQDKVSANVSQDYQKQLADLRARYERLRVQPKADSGGGGATAMPSIPDATGRPDAAAASAPLNEFACEANTLQLGGLQDWVRGVAAVPR